MSKIAQHTELDQYILRQKDKTKPVDQKILPFKDYSVRTDIENSHYKGYKDPKPTDPLKLNYPELSPEQIKYRGLNEKELSQLQYRDDEEYKSQQRYRSMYNTPTKEFEPPNKRYYEINKMLSEEAKKKVLDKYNKFREAAAEFQSKYNEANELASREIELSYEGSYIDLFKNFGKFIVAMTHKHLGILFGILPEGRYDRYSSRTRNLAEFINKGINLFNITTLNLDIKLHEMDTAIHSMKMIIDEYERRKKVLKKLPQLEGEIKTFLLKRDNRAFLKWMDEYFSNDKKDFMESNVKQILEEYWSRGPGFRIGNLKKIKTYSDIFYNARYTATHSLYSSMENKVKYELIDRLKEEVSQRVKPKINAFKNIVDETTADNLEPLAIYAHKNFRLDLKSILNFVQSSYIKYYSNDDIPNDPDRPTVASSRPPVESQGVAEATKNFTMFRENFITDLKESMGAKSVALGVVDNLVTEFIAKYFKAGALDYKEISKLTEKDINELVMKFFKDLIIEKLPNFTKRSYSTYEYSLPGFAGVGSLVKETGKFSIDSIINYAYAAVPFVPKDFLLNLVRSLFKIQIQSKSFTDINKAFEQILYLRGTTPATSMKIFLDLLKRSGKFNPNSFTNEFLNSFQTINTMVGTLQSELKNKFTKQDIIKVFSNILRNVQTVPRDNENLIKLTSFLHNSAGNLTKQDLIKVISNPNFVSYSKIGIVKKLFNIYAKIKNIGGLKGMYDKYGPFIIEMKKEGFVGKNFDKNIRFIVKVFNSGELISPASPIFKKLFEIASETETDLQSIEMGEALTGMLKDYQKKDGRLFNLNLTINENLRFRVLKDKDPRMLRVGIESDCCQRIGGVGESAARDSFINPLAGVLVLEWKANGDWNLLTQSYFHYVPKTNGYILDNIEYNGSNVRDSGVDLAAAYAYLAQKSKEKFDVGYFLAGKSYSKVNVDNFKTHKLHGGDPRFFDPRAGSAYTDFSASNSMDLLEPKFDLDKRKSELTGAGKEIKEAFEINLSMILKLALVA